MGHSYNQGIVTSSKGLALEGVKVTGLDTSPCTVDEDVGANLISSVTQGSTGVLTFQLSAPYPPKLLLCIPTISCAAVTTDIITPRYKDDSYDPTTGQFVVFLSNDDDSGAPVAVSGTSANELHVLLAFGRYSTI